MSIRDDYRAYLERQRSFNAMPMSGYFRQQEKRYIHPFRIFGNLYYVGETWVCIHLIDTGDGLLLIDSGNYNTSGMLVHAIWEAGFNPSSVKWIILPHGHIDHIGNAEFFRNMFGSRLYLSEPDAKMFADDPALAYLHDNPNVTEALFEPDVIIHDGDVLSFGTTRIEFFLVPGHTAGCIACFFDVSDGQDTKRAGYYGGFGFNTLGKSYLRDIGDTSYEMRRRYLSSLEKVIDQPVDIFLGNHAANNNIIEKRNYELEHPGSNPYLDPKEWRSYLDGKKRELLAFMADPANN